MTGFQLVLFLFSCFAIAYFILRYIRKCQMCSSMKVLHTEMYGNGAGIGAPMKIRYRECLRCGTVEEQVFRWGRGGFQKPEPWTRVK